LRDPPHGVCVSTATRASFDGQAGCAYVPAMRSARSLIRCVGLLLAIAPSLSALQVLGTSANPPTAPRPAAMKDPTSFPGWYPLLPGRVVTIPASPGAATVEDVVPVPTPFNHPVKHLIAAWNGGTLIEVEGDPYLAIHGGGHADYAGNEIAIFGPLTSDLPAWSLLSLPTPQALIDIAYPYNFDGTPNVSHTRDTLCFLDGMIYRALQAGIYSATNSWDTFDSFDVAAESWAPEATHPDVPTGGGVRGSAVADTNRGVIWMLRDGTGAQLKMFDPATNAWTEYASTYYTAIETTAAISASRDEIFLYEASVNPRQSLFNLRFPNLNPLTQGFTGTPPPTKCGLVWDEGRQVYAALGTGDRSLVYELDPVIQRWTTRQFVGPTEPQPQDGNGIFGRFQYVAQLRGYVYLGATDGSVYFYRSQ